MDIGQLYDNLNVVLNRHSSGNSYSPKEFNTLVSVEILNFFNDQINKLRVAVSSEDEFRESILSSKILRKLIIKAAITPSTGVAAMTSLTGFSHWLSCMTTAVFNGRLQKVELVSYNEYEERQTNLLKPPIYYNPICVITTDTGVSNFNFYPTNIGEISLTYMKVPSTPKYDYYIDANRNIVFFASGSRTLSTGEVGSAGQISGSISSTTVELDFPEEYYSEFFDYLLSRLGIRAENGLIYQSAEYEKSK